MYVCINLTLFIRTFSWWFLQKTKKEISRFTFLVINVAWGLPILYVCHMSSHTYAHDDNIILLLTLQITASATRNNNNNKIKKFIIKCCYNKNIPESFCTRTEFFFLFRYFVFFFLRFNRKQETYAARTKLQVIVVSNWLVAYVACG